MLTKPAATMVAAVSGTPKRSHAASKQTNTSIADAIVRRIESRCLRKNPVTMPPNADMRITVKTIGETSTRRLEGREASPRVPRHHIQPVLQAIVHMYSAAFCTFTDGVAPLSSRSV